MTHNGPRYLDGTRAFANAWFTSDRAASGDQFTAPNRSLIAKFDGEFAGRQSMVADQQIIERPPASP